MLLTTCQNIVKRQNKKLRAQCNWALTQSALFYRREKGNNKRTPWGIITPLATLPPRAPRTHAPIPRRARSPQPEPGLIESQLKLTVKDSWMGTHCWITDLIEKQLMHFFSVYTGKSFFVGISSRKTAKTPWSRDLCWLWH